MRTSPQFDRFPLLPVLGPIVGGAREYNSPVPVMTWEDNPLASPRLTKPGARKVVTELIVHETVDYAGAEDTLATLRKRKLSVHLINDAHGNVTQHADLVTDVAAHAGGHNGASIGVECDNPYYPSNNRRRDLWPLIIDAPWAHGGKYTVPTPQTAETMAALIDYFTRGTLPGIEIPRRWVGLRDGRMLMTTAAWATGPGIYAHHYFAHADGAWLVLYAYLRLEGGASAEDARAEAVRLATGARGAVAVPAA